MKKDFPLATVLTITDGKLIAPNRIEGVYEILNHMTGDNIFTHQIPRVGRECVDPLLEQFPFLKDIAVPMGLDSEEKIAEWIAPFIAEHGSTLAVEQMDPAEHTHIHPLVEAQMAFPNAEIIAVKVETEGENE